MIANPLVAVEEVNGRVAFRRFVEMGFALHRGDLRWAPGLAAFERARLAPGRNPFFDAGDGEYFLVRAGGRLCGRITAHVAGPDDDAGWFGFFDVADDAGAAVALVDQARAWLRERGCTTITGPVSFTPADDPGVLVAGFDAPGVTGRPWHPPWYAAHLEAAGLQPAPGTDHPTWRLSTETARSGERESSPRLPTLARTTPSVGQYGDPRLVRDGIVGVPDISAALRVSPLELARRAKRRSYDTAVVVELDGDPSVLVPELRAAAGAAGYRWLIAPWTDDPSAPPETVHRLYTGPTH